MITDPIADLFVRIRNGYLARLQTVTCPYSKTKERILVILKKNKHIVDFTVEGEGVEKHFAISLNNVKETEYVPTFKRVSKPGRRVYIAASDIKKSRNGLGIYIVSTSKGIITGYEARALNVGGEVIGEVF